MIKTITYQCVECSSELEVKEDAHEDPDTYFECECGELMQPISCSGDGDNEE